MAAKTHCFAIGSLRNLPRARVMAESIRRNHPAWAQWYFLIDREPPGFELRCDHDFDGILRFADLSDQPEPGWLFGLDEQELGVAARIFAFRLLLSDDAQHVVCVNADVVLNPLVHVQDALQHHAVVATPRWNGGLIAVRNDALGRELVAKALDGAPAYSPDSSSSADRPTCCLDDAAVHLLSRPGYGVVAGTMNNSDLRIGVEGNIWVGQDLLHSLSFAGLESWSDLALTSRFHGRMATLELLRWFRSRVARYAVADLPSDWWYFGRYEDGTPILAAHRLEWRRRVEFRQAFKNPFTSGSDTFQALMQHDFHNEAGRAFGALPPVR